RVLFDGEEDFSWWSGIAGILTHPWCNGRRRRSTDRSFGAPLTAACALRYANLSMSSAPGDPGIDQRLNGLFLHESACRINGAPPLGRGPVFGIMVHAAELPLFAT